MAIIGITRCSAPADYRAAVTAAGGTPLLLEPGVLTPEQACGRIDGLLLSGGGNIHPRRYGEEPLACVRRFDPARDELELGLAALALQRDVPLLGICRGLQVLNVACGGSLWQDLPTQRPGAIRHRVRRSYDLLVHEVRVAPGSLLARLLGPELGVGETCMVNSRHRQAAKRVAGALVPTAWAPDGVIEALEHPEAGFCLGVQWHPENFWRDGRFQGLLHALVRAAGG